MANLCSLTATMPLVDSKTCCVFRSAMGQQISGPNGWNLAYCFDPNCTSAGSSPNSPPPIGQVYKPSSVSSCVSECNNLTIVEGNYDVSKVNQQLYCPKSSPSPAPSIWIYVIVICVILLILAYSIKQ